MTNQDDLISRVKHAIYKICLSEGNEDIFVKILDEINKLPSVKQESKTEKVIKMRDATPEEREVIDKYIKSISRPIGVNFCTLEEALEHCDRNICIKNEYNGIGCDECEVTKSQEPKILNTLDFAIDASNGETNYFVGFRNGLRYAKSLIDGEEEPQFESCTEKEPKTDVLDKIRSEIDFHSTTFIHGERYIEKDFALEIIDKYREPQESEEV